MEESEKIGLQHHSREHNLAGSPSAEEHKSQSPQHLKIALFTVSTSRFRDKSLRDESGELATEMCRKEGHVASHEIIDDSKAMIRLSLMKALYEKDCQAVVFLGGTGLSPRDVTIEAIFPILDKHVEGFGEVFRRLSFDEIGSPALMSRALMGTVENRVIVCLPGSPNAAKTGMKLALSELPHAVNIASSKP